jgi:GT2 family glycosyltransferase
MSRVAVSVVSHAQGALVKELLADLQRCATPIEVILTINIPETLPFAAPDFRFPLRIVANAAPRGFGANHNAAFALADAPYFCVLNPDIHIDSDPFPALIEALADPGVAVAAPLVRNSRGGIEDSARKFPTLSRLLKKLFGAAMTLDYEIGGAPIEPDWVAGMFMLIRRERYAALRGFDERYFLYYEDVDLCARARLAGGRIVLDPRAEVVHEARRASRRHPRLALYHAASLLRYFLQFGRR